MRRILPLLAPLLAPSPTHAQVFDDLLLAPDPTFYSSTQVAVAGHEDFAVLGVSPLQDEAWLFHWNPATSRWDLDRTLVPTGVPLHSIGSSVDIGQHLLVVGDRAVSSSHGAVYAWYRDPGTGDWTETTPVIPPQSGPPDGLGSSVLVDGLNVYVGAPHRTVQGLPDAGAVLGFRFDPALATWTPLGEWTAATPIEDGGFGWALAKDGPWMLVGAPGGLFSPPGSISVLHSQGGTWSVTQTIPDPVGGNYFGWRIGMHGDLAAAVAEGVVFAYRRDATSGQYSIEADFATLTDQYATSLTVGEETIVAGAEFDAHLRGRVAVFRHPGCSGGTWVQTHDLHTVHEHQGSAPALGESVDLEGDRILAAIGDYTKIGGPHLAAATTLTVALDCDGNGQADVCDIAGGAADLDEDGVLDACEAVGARYCSPNEANSTGHPAWLLAEGSKTVARDRLVLTMGALPANQFGLFLASRQPGFVPHPGGSEGNLCLSGKLGRIPLPFHQWWTSGSDGTIHGILDLSAIPVTPPVPVLPGDTWCFQGWYRDGSKSNFTDAVAVTFD